MSWAFPAKCPTFPGGVSSLKVADGYQVTLYADRDCQGASQTFTTDTPRLDGFNDIASSVSVTAPARSIGVPPQPIPTPSSSSSPRS